MLDELKVAINEYQTEWKKLIASINNQDFFNNLKPTSVAYKTVDLKDFDMRLNELKDHCDQIHLGWINERWLATLHLKEDALPWGIEIIKLMQRRPSSTDATGLDHLDFYYNPKPSTAKSIVEKEQLKWSEEKNGEHCQWLSVWFANTEAKIRSDTVLDVCAQELKDIEKQILT